MNVQANSLQLLMMILTVLGVWCHGIVASEPDAEKLYQSALQSLKLGQLDTANRTLHSVLRRNPRHAQALVQLFYLSCKASDVRSAIALESRLLALMAPPPQLRGMLASGWAEVRFQ